MRVTQFAQKSTTLSTTKKSHDIINKGCVTLCGLAIYIKKYLKAKEELWKLKYFTMQKYNLQKTL
jgi:hypothetical protein